MDKFIWSCYCVILILYMNLVNMVHICLIVLNKTLNLVEQNNYSHNHAARLKMVEHSNLVLKLISILSMPTGWRQCFRRRTGCQTCVFGRRTIKLMKTKVVCTTSSNSGSFWLKCDINETSQFIRNQWKSRSYVENIILECTN